MVDRSTHLHVDIISPEKPLYSGEVLSLVAPSYDGEIGILKQHAPLVTQLGIGEVRIKEGSLGGEQTVSFAVRRGFLQTLDNHVIIVSEEAKSAQDVDEKAVKTKLEELEQEIRQEKNLEKRQDLQEKVSWLKTQLGLLRK